MEYTVEYIKGHGIDAPHWVLDGRGTATIAVQKENIGGGEYYFIGGRMWKLAENIGISMASDKAREVVEC